LQADDPVTNVAYILANHLGGQTLLSPVLFADAHEQDIVVDPSDRSFQPAPSIDASRASSHRPSVDWGRPVQPSSVGARLGKNHLQNGTEARRSSGRDPPRHLPLQPASGVGAGTRSTDHAVLRGKTNNWGLIFEHADSIRELNHNPPLGVEDH
jgi:hypothetical protein